MMPMNYIENRTYDEIKVGDSATITRTVKPADIQLFAIMSGDVNPAHVDPEYAKSSMFREVIAHGMWGGALISTVLGTQFPGPGTIYIDQTLHFSRPVGLGDTITATLTAKRKFDHNHHIVFDCLCTNQDGQKVIGGTAEVLSPTEKIKRARIELPEVTLLDREACYQHLPARTSATPPAPPRRGADERLIAHRRADGRGRGDRRRSAHRAARQPRVHRRCADLSAHAARHRCQAQAAA